mgnify:CR=1 FL=1
MWAQLIHISQHVDGKQESNEEVEDLSCLIRDLLFLFVLYRAAFLLAHEDCELPVLLMASPHQPLKPGVNK